MENALGDDKLADLLTSVVAGDRTEATAQISGLLVTLLAAKLGPAAPIAGAVAQGTVKRVAKLVADNATKRFLAAGKKLDDAREFADALRSAIGEALSDATGDTAVAVDELGLQSQEQFLQLLKFLQRNVVEPQDEVLGLLREMHRDVAVAAASRGGTALVALGPNTVAIGERTGIDESRWSLQLESFVVGGIDTLSQFIEHFDGMPSLHRFVVIQDGMDAREVVAAPAWEKTEKGVVVRLSVGPAVEPTDTTGSYDLDTSSLAEDGNFRRVWGGEKVERLLQRHLAYQQGESISELCASWLRSWFNQIGKVDRDLAERLVCIEVLRTCHLPAKQSFGVKAPVLHGIERVQGVSVRNFHDEGDRYIISLRIGLMIRGLGLHTFDSEVSFTKQPRINEPPTMMDEFKAREEVTTQISGYWFKAGEGMDNRPKYPPDGAFAPATRGDEPLVGMVLIRVKKQWRCMAFGGASGLAATAGIQRGEDWDFCEYGWDSKVKRVWRAEALESVPADDVEERFGTETKWRSPLDRASLAVRFRLTKGHL